jgi:hypothetical protein
VALGSDSILLKMRELAGEEPATSGASDLDLNFLAMLPQLYINVENETSFHYWS